MIRFNSLFDRFKVPVIVSSFLVIPLIALEWINRRSFHEGFPFVLFGILWLLPIAFFSVLLPIVRDMRAGNNIFANTDKLLLKVAFLAFIALLWGGIILDQFPCFLGVPNCD